jgi:NAD-dependent dihydropyrimidine dehydrogenase PreA subunit
MNIERGPEALEAHNPIQINPNTCIRCNLCDWVCPGDIIYKKENDKTTLPVVAFPDECWYCGHCESVCPADAITIVFPDQMLHNRTDVTDLLGEVDVPPAGTAGGA